MTIPKAVNSDSPDPAPAGVEVEMDGRILWFGDLPPSLGALLERLARRSLCRRRMVEALHVDGMRVHPDKAGQVVTHFQHLKVQTISLDVVQARRLQEALAQADHLRQQVRVLAMVLLINEFPAVRSLWQNTVPDLRQLLISSWNLEELRDVQNPRLESAWISLTRHLERIEATFSRIEWMFLEYENHWGLTEAVKLSEEFENGLATWLEELGGHLSRLGEHLVE